MTVQERTLLASCQPIARSLLLKETAGKKQRSTAPAIRQGSTSLAGPSSTEDVASNSMARNRHLVVMVESENTLCC